MLHTINTKILLSGAVILAASAVIVGATFAFFSDSETSAGNTFAAGQLDLKVDAHAHYAGLVCNKVDDNVFQWVDDLAVEEPTTRPDLLGDTCQGTWSETDLGPTNQFFNLSDIKPGDEGENTISLHVLDNDAWGRLVIDNIFDNENACGGEEVAVDPACALEVSPNGELQNNLQFSIWLDEGLSNGFQCGATPSCEADPTEGDNVQQETELTLVTAGTLDEGGETLNIYDGLAAAWVANGSADFPGLMADGRMVGDITYYFGLDWNLPTTAGNDIQTDSMLADMTFEVVQHRNNPSKNGF